MIGTYIIQIIMAFFGSLGFSILFNIRGKKLLSAGFGGAVIWAIYIIANIMGAGKVGGSLIASAAATLLAEIFSRIMKAPVIILLVPMLIPLIPGSDLYYTMNNLILNQVNETIQYGQLVLEEAGAIAFGIILVTTVVQVIMKMGKKLLQF